MRRLFAIFLFAILFGGYAFSYDFSAVCESGQTLYYNITSNVEPYTVEVTREFEEFVDLGYDTYPTGNLEIPESVEYNSITYSVTGIGENAFYGCSGLTSVTIPNSVTSIGNGAFYLVRNIVYNGSATGSPWDALTLNGYIVGSLVYSDETKTYLTGCNIQAAWVTIPSSVTSIGDYAFYGCDGLSEVTIPGSVTSIGNYAFDGCSNLTNINCLCENPPINASTTFSTYETTTLNVPVSSVEAYQSAQFWNNFAHIEFLPSVTTWTDSNGMVWSFTANGTEATNIQPAISDKSYIYGDPNHTEQVPVDIPAWEYPSGCFSNTEGRCFPYISDEVYFGHKTLFFDIVATEGSDCKMSVMNAWWSRFYAEDVPVSVGLWKLPITGAIANDCARGGRGLAHDLTIMMINGTITIKSVYYTASPISVPDVMVIPEKVYVGSTELTVTSIGDFAFSDCSGLTSVTIPYSVTSIGKSAFYGCSELETITVESGNTVYDSRDNCNAIIETATNKLIAGCNNTTIPNSVNSIGDYAFSDCTGLTSVTIPNSVTSIGNWAFSDCSGLTSLTIPNSITSIGNYAFQNSGLETITVESGNTVYDSRDNCNAIIETATNKLIAGYKNTTIPNSVTSIDNYAFENCTRLFSVTIPDEVESIGNDAFYNVKNIVYHHESATGSPWGALTLNGFIDDDLVYSDESKTNLTGCNPSATSVTIPNSVTNIGSSAFDGCSGLTEITIPSGVTSLGASAFNCNGLLTVNYNAINCSNQGGVGPPFGWGGNPISSVNIGDSVINVPEMTFYGLYELTSVTIGKSVENIGSNAFVNSENLIDINILAENPPILGAADVFPSQIYTSATLWTPCAADEAYRNDSLWGQFTDIQNDTTPLVLTAQTADSDMGSVTGDGTFSCETEANIVATANEHYHFVQWNDGNTDNPRTITVTGDTTYTATFAIDQHTVMVVSNNSTKGTVSGGGTFDYGEEREIEAIANEGYRFLSWNDNNTDNPRTITVSGDTLYIATFEVDDTPQPVYVTIADTACGSYTWNDATYTETNSYYQTFTASNSADSIVRLDLVIYPLPQPEITIDGILSTGEYEEYNWSTGENTGTATVTAPGQYYVEVVDTNGCRGLSEMATVGYSSLLTVAPQLKYVGLRYSGTASCNMVQWTLNNADTVGVRGFEIYREDTETAIYTLVQRIAKPLQRSWTDPTADFTARAYRYKICAIDECGGMSPMSEPHKTMHLTINRGAGTTWNLIWSHYEGVEFGTYEIYRGTSSRNMVRIAVIPSSINSYTDNTNTLEEGMFYQIKIVGSSGAKNEEFELYSNVVANEYVEDYTISVFSNNENFGVAAGSGTYPAGLDVTLMAIPNDGYEFVSWNDGNTENPRTITVSGNAAYVATFGEASSSVTNYTITAVPANPSQGTVTGGGIYPEGTEITIEAIAAEGYEFISWSDDNTENPRIITVTADAMFIASFAPATDIEESVTTEINIFPNPAKDILNITSSETISEIAIVNVMGQVVRRIEVNSDNAVCNVEELKAGVYASARLRLRSANENL